MYIETEERKRGTLMGQTTTLHDQQSHRLSLFQILHAPGAETHTPNETKNKPEVTCQATHETLLQHKPQIQLLEKTA